MISGVLTEKGKTMTEFITRNHGNESFEIIIKTDSREHYIATEDFARRMIDHAKPMTNADRIRAMTNEELADLLAYGCISPVRSCRQSCRDCILDWLREMAEV